MKQDKKLVSKNQKYEPAYIAKTYNIPIEVVQEAITKAGRSRKKIYSILKEWGYEI